MLIEIIAFAWHFHEIGRPTPSCSHATPGGTAAKYATAVLGEKCDTNLHSAWEGFIDPIQGLNCGARNRIATEIADTTVTDNILDRGRHTYVGIDTLAFSSIESTDVLRSVMPGFAPP